jgi:hypothetical protein
VQHFTLQYHPKTFWSAPLPKDLDSENTLVWVFGSRGLASNHEIWAVLREAFARSCFMGCSTSGEIHKDQVEDESLSVAVVRFDKTQLKTVNVAIVQAADSYQTGVQLAQQLQAPDLRAVFLLSDGLNVNGTNLVRGLREPLSAEVVITGGLAGDGTQFQHTWVLCDAVPRCHHVAAVGFYGDSLTVGHGSCGGWSDFGPERLVTRSEDNVLYELDGRPALDLYKSYLGERAGDLPGSALLFPLTFKDPVTESADPLVRTILNVDEENNSMTFAGDIPQGVMARLMRCRNEDLIDAAGLAARQALQPLGGRSQPFVVSVSCVGRRLILGERTEEELEAVIQQMPTDGAHVGFYSYGEISPVRGGQGSHLHNQTMTVTAFDEH